MATAFSLLDAFVQFDKSLFTAFYLVEQLGSDLLLNLSLVYVIYQRHYRVWHIAELTSLHEPVAVDPEMLV